MEQFIAKHADKIEGPLSCFDRMLFRGYLPLFNGAAMAAFLDSHGVQRQELKSFLFRNLLLDLEPVTVDKWIGRAWGLKHNPSSLASYNQIASTIRRVSWQMRDPMTGHRPAKPAQIQAAIWRGIQKEHGVKTDDVAQLINQSQWGSVQWR